MMKFFSGFLKPLCSGEKRLKSLIWGISVYDSKERRKEASLSLYLRRKGEKAEKCTKRKREKNRLDVKWEDKKRAT